MEAQLHLRSVLAIPARPGAARDLQGVSGGVPVEFDKRESADAGVPSGAENAGLPGAIA